MNEMSETELAEQLAEYESWEAAFAVGDPDAIRERIEAFVPRDELLVVLSPKGSEALVPNYVRRAIGTDDEPADQLAWSALQMLAAHLLDEGQSFPDSLLDWAKLVAAGRCPRPSRTGRPANADRNIAWMHTVWELREAGHTREAALELVAKATSHSIETVRTALKSARRSSDLG